MARLVKNDRNPILKRMQKIFFSRLFLKVYTTYRNFELTTPTYNARLVICRNEYYATSTISQEKRSTMRKVKQSHTLKILP